MNAVLALTNPARDSDDEPLVRTQPKKKKKKPQSDSDHDPAAASSNEPRALPAPPRKRRLGVIGKQSEQAAANEGITVTPAWAPVPPKRMKNKQQSDRSKLYREVQGSGQQLRGKFRTRIAKSGNKWLKKRSKTVVRVTMVVH